MEYRYLRAFISVCEHQNFTQAGEELKVAQSAISRQIRLLEDSLGVQLLVRSPQQIQLTPQGKRLYEQSSKFHHWISNEFYEFKKDIRIATLPGVLENWLTCRLLSIGKNQLPNLSIKHGSMEAIQKMLENGEVDIGLISHKLDTENLSSQKIFREKFVLISKDTVDTTNLHKYRWIYSDRGSYLNKASKKKSEEYIQVESLSTLLKMVEEGMGIAILASHIVDQSKYRFKKVKMPKLKGDVYLCMPNYYILPKYLKSFLENLVKDT